MQGGDPSYHRYEEHVYVLDFRVRGRSSTVRGKEGTIVTSIGEDWMTLLEVLGGEGAEFEVGERICIGREGRTKAASVLGKMEYGRISAAAKAELARIVERIVAENERRFVGYINGAEPLTPRVHALELIPGIGKTYLRAMLEERKRAEFEGYADLEERVGFKDPVKRLTERIIDEVTGRSRMNLFAKR